MNKYLFDRLNYYIPTLPISIEESNFYDNHAMLFSQSTREFVDTYLPSKLIRADIILHSLHNKELIEEEITNYSSAQLEKKFLVDNIFNDLIYFTFEGVKIYIPTYDKETNLLFRKKLYSFKNENEIFIKNKNHKVINPFDYYKNKIYESNFCRLIKLDVNNAGDEFFYHNDLNTLMVINNGQIINEFAIEPSNENKIDLFSNLRIAAKGYFSLNENDFLNLLLEKKLIPNNVYKEVYKDLLKKCILK